jgi:hypothetical protein
MNNLDAYLEVSAKIQRGELDAQLGILRDKIDARLKAIKQEITIADFSIGDRVAINGKCRPKYMQGLTGVIVDKKVVKLVMTLDKPQGKYSGRVTIPPYLLDKIEV